MATVTAASAAPMVLMMLMLEFLTMEVSLFPIIMFVVVVSQGGGLKGSGAGREVRGWRPPFLVMPPAPLPVLLL